MRPTHLGSPAAASGPATGRDQQVRKTCFLGPVPGDDSPPQRQEATTDSSFFVQKYLPSTALLRARARRNRTRGNRKVRLRPAWASVSRAVRGQATLCLGEDRQALCSREATRTHSGYAERLRDIQPRPHRMGRGWGQGTGVPHGDGEHQVLWRRAELSATSDPMCQGQVLEVGTRDRSQGHSGPAKTSRPHVPCLEITGNSRNWKNVI